MILEVWYLNNSDEPTSESGWFPGVKQPYAEGLWIDRGTKWVPPRRIIRIDVVKED